MLLAAVALIVLSPTQEATSEVWVGDFRLTLKGKGRATGPVPNWGTWDIRREARGTIILDRTFRGSGIAGSPDNNNLARYETWVSTQKRPAEMKILDVINVYGPMFAANTIRDDTFRVRCPVDPAQGEWAPAVIGTPILQFDYTKGEFIFESPRIYSTAYTFFNRKFVKGPASWTKKKPLLQEGNELEFEMVHQVNTPADWTKIKGKFRPGQTSVTLSRKFVFGANLGASVKAGRVDGELTLAMRRVPKAEAGL